jgi:hypothetical protein
MRQISFLESFPRLSNRNAANLRSSEMRRFPMVLHGREKMMMARGKEDKEEGRRQRDASKEAAYF